MRAHAGPQSTGKRGAAGTVRSRGRPARAPGSRGLPEAPAWAAAQASSACGVRSLACSIPEGRELRFATFRYAALRGWAANNAPRRKRSDTYPELTRAGRCRLVVIGIQVGGRFGAEAATIFFFVLRLLARQRAAAVPAHLRPAAQAAWVARWAALLAIAAQQAYASSLLELPLAGEVNGVEVVPDLPQLLADVGGENSCLCVGLALRLDSCNAGLKRRDKKKSDAATVRAGAAEACAEMRSHVAAVHAAPSRSSRNNQPQQSEHGPQSEKKYRGEAPLTHA